MSFEIRQLLFPVRMLLLRIFKKGEKKVRTTQRKGVEQLELQVELELEVVVRISSLTTTEPNTVVGADNELECLGIGKQSEFLITI